MRRLTIATLAVTAAISPARATPDFDFIRQGMSIVQADRLMIDAGWQSNGNPFARYSAPDSWPYRAYHALGIRSVSWCRDGGADGDGCTYRYVDARGETVSIRADGNQIIERWRLNAPDGW